MRFKNQTNESFSEYFDKFMQKVDDAKKIYNNTKRTYEIITKREDEMKPKGEPDMKRNEEFLKAMFNADVNRVKDFILMGFDVNQRIHEYTPLTKACSFFKVQTCILFINILIEAGANPNMSNSRHQTPLDTVCERYAKATNESMPKEDAMLLIDELVKHGATITAKNLITLSKTGRAGSAVVFEHACKKLLKHCLHAKKTLTDALYEICKSFPTFTNGLKHRIRAIITLLQHGADPFDETHETTPKNAFYLNLSRHEKENRPFQQLNKEISSLIVKAFHR